MDPAHRITELDSGLRIVTEAMPSVRSAALGFFVATGSRGETRGRGRALALPRAPAVPRHGPLRVGARSTSCSTAWAPSSTPARTRRARGLRAHARPAPARGVRRDGRHGVAPRVQRRGPRARGRARGDRHVRGRSAGHGVRRARRGRLRRPPAGRPDHRPRAGDPGHAGGRDRRLPRARATCRAGGHRRGRLGRPRRDRRAGRAHARRPRAMEPRAGAGAGAASTPAATVRFLRKDTEQCHVSLGGLGLPRGDERRFAARVLDAIFGGLSSSRLFQAVREERGLAYSVYSFAGQYADTGQIGLYVGTRPDNLAEAMRSSATSSSACARSRPPRRSSARARERQGAGRAGHGVHRRAHAPARRLAAVRPAAAGDRRGRWSASTP